MLTSKLMQNLKYYPRFYRDTSKLYVKLINRSNSAKCTYPSATRNSKPIADALLPQVDSSTPGRCLLEISSGSGQHAGFLAPLLPNITFQPTEFDRTTFPSIEAYANDCPTKNIRSPFYVDVSHDPKDWTEAKKCGLQSEYDYMLNCNMMHISPFECSVGLFRAAGQLLKQNAKLFTYGPYALDGVLQPNSNIEFDKSLRARNPLWGVRDIRDLKELATKNGLRLELITEMPSNNKLLTWMKT